ncbi:non-histone chromosomal MC1 family protein [Halorhabdus tiamatea]|uniref:non-histone chromosomal MC1 family protein n=1 Tax=Halorhabdus tiamatea TaxID=430914 RepID=UPI0013783CEF|nr:non-histone chromosomal MC1 family protein [Halorhabdus tiamatea]
MSATTSGDTQKRKFTIHYQDGTEDHLFRASEPYLAALKGARSEVDPNGYTDSETAKQENSARLYLREIGTRTLYVYKVWTWTQQSACPECGSRRVYRRKMKSPPYRCPACEAEFDEPADAADVDQESDLPEWLSDSDDDNITGAEATGLGKSKVPEGEQFDKSR